MNQKKQLIEDRNDKVERMEQIVNLAKTENRVLTDEEDKEFKALNAEVCKIDNTLKAMEIVNGMISMEPVPGSGSEEEKRKAERKAFENYIRFGRIDNANMTKGANGAIIPASIAEEIVKTVYEKSDLISRMRLYHQKGKFSVPVYTDGITVAYASDFTALTSSAGSFSSVDLEGFLAGALTKIGLELVNNAKFDVVAFVINDMGEAIARWIEKELIIGTNQKIAGLSGITNVTNAGAATVLSADDLVNLQDSVKSKFQQKACWLMNSKTRTACRKLKGNDGHFLLNDNLAAPFGIDILGKPVIINDDMPDIAANAKAIIYGDFAGLSGNMPEEIEIKVLQEKFADEHAVGVIGYFQLDAKVTTQQALGVLKMAAADPEE